MSREFCAHDQLISVYSYIDPVRHGPKILRLCERLEREVEFGTLWYHRINGKRAAALVALDRRDEARGWCARGLDDLLGAPRGRSYCEHHIAALTLQLALIDALEGKRTRAVACATRVSQRHCLDPTLASRRYRVLLRVCGHTPAQLRRIVAQAVGDLPASSFLSAAVQLDAAELLAGDDRATAAAPLATAALSIARVIDSPWLLRRARTVAAQSKIIG